jgi:hypothetical protein
VIDPSTSPAVGRRLAAPRSLDLIEHRKSFRNVDSEQFPNQRLRISEHVKLIPARQLPCLLILAHLPSGRRSGSDPMFLDPAMRFDVAPAPLFSVFADPIRRINFGQSRGLAKAPLQLW